MGRKRIDLGESGNAKIAAMTRRGKSAEEIAQALGISPATARRRKREAKAGGKAERVARRAAAPAPAPAPTPAASDDLPENLDEALTEGTSLEQIDKWLKKAEQKANEADDGGDVDNHVKYVRLAKDLLEARRKATPIQKQDPNEQPDMLAAASKVRDRWHALAENLFRVSHSPVAETIGRLMRTDALRAG